MPANMSLIQAALRISGALTFSGLDEAGDQVEPDLDQRVSADHRVGVQAAEQSDTVELAGTFLSPARPRRLRSCSRSTPCRRGCRSETRPAAWPALRASSCRSPTPSSITTPARRSTVPLLRHVARGAGDQPAAQRSARRARPSRRRRAAWRCIPRPRRSSAKRGVAVDEQVRDRLVHLRTADPAAVAGQEVRRQRRRDDDAVGGLGQPGRGVAVERSGGQEAVLQIDQARRRRTLRDVPVRGHLVSVAAVDLQRGALHRDRAAPGQQRRPAEHPDRRTNTG